MALKRFRPPKIPTNTDSHALGTALNGGPLEEITPELIEELVRDAGWSADELEKAARKGGKFSRHRNSVFLPDRLA